MSKVKKAGTVLQWILICIIASLFIAAVTYPLRVESKIEMGMSKAEVMSIAGDSRVSEHDNLELLCANNQLIGCKRALEAGAAHFVSWSVGIDTILAVGFNENSEVIFTTIGDT